MWKWDDLVDTRVEALAALSVGSRSSRMSPTFISISSPVEALDGLLDEVSVYDRALTAAEIQAIFDAGSAGKCGS